MKTLALGASLGFLVSFAAEAAPPVPLAVTPVRALIAAASLGGGCSPEGTSSAFLTGPIGGGGTMTSSVSVAASDAYVSLSGSTGPSGFGGNVLFQVEVDVTVPDLGQAMTPVFVSLEDVVTPASGHIESISLEPGRMILPCGTDDKFARPASALLGNQVGSVFDGGAFDPVIADNFAFYGKPAGSSVPPGIRHGVVPHAFLAGDTVRLPIVANAFLTTPGGGAYSGSFRIAFRTAPVTLGSGDVNGDTHVNILDVTKIRRAIAGLPN